MAIIGTFSRAKTGGWEGKIRMLSAAMAARFVPNDNRESEAAPHFRVLSDSSELGAAWVRRSGADNTEFLSVQLGGHTQGLTHSLDPPFLRADGVRERREGGEAFVELLGGRLHATTYMLFNSPLSTTFMLLDINIITTHILSISSAHGRSNACQ